MVFPYFSLNFTNKEEIIFSHYFMIITSSFENRYEQSLHTISNPIGSLLFEFLDADLSNEYFVKRATLKYGSIALDTDSLNNDFEDQLNDADKYEETIEQDLFESLLDEYSKLSINEYKQLQDDLKHIINFVYNIDNINYLYDLTPSQRYFIFLQNISDEERLRIFSYISSVEMTHDFDFSALDSFQKLKSCNAEEMAKIIKKEDKKNHNYNLTNYFYSFSSLISAYYFCLFHFIENNIPIKKCKNCEKYFIPENRNSSIYCNRIFENKKTCKEIGANNAYNEKLKKDEVNRLYRRTLSAKKMLANRNPDIPIYLEKYEKWKSEANKFKQDIKEGKKTEEEFKNWIEKTRKNY